MSGVRSEGVVPASVTELIDAAIVAQGNAHCPYSHYPVGAAIRAGSGRVYAGCNVENAAYPEGTCAEDGAIAAMVLAGEREIVEVAVVTPGNGTPCGGCRQRLREFAAPDVLIHSTTTAGAVLTLTMADLLPDSFGPDQLA